MKKVSAILAIALAVIMLAFVPYAYGASEGIISDSVDGTAGSEVTVSLYLDHELKDNEAISALQFSIMYDPNSVEYVEVNAPENSIAGDFQFFVNHCKDDGTDAKKPIGEFAVACADTTGVERTGLIFSIKFKLLNDTGSALVIRDLFFCCCDTVTQAMTDYSGNNIIMGGISCNGKSVPNPLASMISEGATVTAPPASVTTSKPTSSGYAISTPNSTLSGTARATLSTTSVAGTPAPDVTSAATDAIIDAPSQEPVVEVSTEPEPTEASPEIGLTTEPPTGGDVTNEPVQAETAAPDDTEPQSNTALLIIIIVGGLGLALVVVAAIILIARKKR